MTKKTGVLNKSMDYTIRSAKMLGSLDMSPLGRVITDLFHDIEKYHGTRQAIAQLKAYYQESIRFSCGLKVTPVSPIWVKRGKDNYPNVLNRFRKPLREGSTLERRMCLSILRTFESIELRPIPDLSSVISPSTGASGFASIRKSWDNFLSRSRFARIMMKRYVKNRDQARSNTFFRLHFSAKKGVCGPTCCTAGVQSLALTDEILEVLTKFNDEFRCGTTFAKVVKDNQRSYSSGKDLFPNCNKEVLTSNLGKISFIPDKGGKTRLVAIGNYWIQDSLLQLHKVLYKILGSLPVDGTYDQESQFERVRQQSLIGPVWSYDLTAATDRFPIEPQQSVLEHLSKDMGSTWSKLLSMMSFLYEGNQYKYRVGQPMGLYSSWASFALTHHFVVQYCAWIEKEEFPFDKYAILGDDVAIWSEKVARRYRRLLSLFDVNISESKSFTPESNKGPCVAEFAKRISDRGLEISPLSPNQSKEAWESYVNFPQYLNWLQSHHFEVSTIPASKVSQLAGLQPYRFRNLCCLLHVWELLRSPVLQGYQEYEPEEFRIWLSTERLTQLRSKLLMDQALDLWKDLFNNPEETNRDKLEESLGRWVSDNDYFLIIMRTRLQDIKELNQGLMGSPLNFLSGLQSMMINASLSDIEYIPHIDFHSLMSGLTRHESKKTMRGRYIQRLVKEAKATMRDLERNAQ